MCRSQKFPIDAQTGPYTVGTPGCQDCPGPNFPLVSKHWYKLHYPALIDFSLTDSFSQTPRRYAKLQAQAGTSSHLWTRPECKIPVISNIHTGGPRTKKESYVRTNTTPSPF